MNINWDTTITTTTGTGNWIYNPTYTVPRQWHWEPDPWNPWQPDPWNPWKPYQPRKTSPWQKVKPTRKRRAPVKKRKKSIKARTKGRKETYITLILDRSGSMGSCYHAALGAINEQIETIKDNAHKGGKTYISLVLFDHEVEIVFENVLAQDVEHLTEEDYQIRGSTALRDAVMSAIDLMEEYEDDRKNQGFLVVLISDGQENSSGTPREELQSRIEELNASDTWTFTYMLDGHSWEQVQEFSLDYASPMGNMCCYTSNSAGTATAGNAMSSAIINYMDVRGSGGTKSKKFYNEGDGSECKT